MQVEMLNKDGSVLLPEGNDLLAAPSPPAADVPSWADLPPARARPGESRKQTWERLRQEARSAGMAKREAYIYATREVDRVWMPPEPVAEPEPPAPEPEPEIVEPASVVEPPAAQEPPPAAAADGLAGLSELPDTWPPLPANAALAVEVAWVQASRLRVVHGGAVDLGRALGPAPSHAALAWLETSVLFPAKWADVCVRATQDQQDDQQDVRRERVALAEIQALLAEVAAAAAAT